MAIPTRRRSICAWLVTCRCGWSSLFRRGSALVRAAGTARRADAPAQAGARRAPGRDRLGGEGHGLPPDARRAERARRGHRRKRRGPPGPGFQHDARHLHLSSLRVLEAARAFRCRSAPLSRRRGRCRPGRSRRGARLPRRWASRKKPGGRRTPNRPITLCVPPRSKKSAAKNPANCGLCFRLTIRPSGPASI